MNVVKTYRLNAKREEQTISVPKDAKILSVCVTHENVYVFVEQDVNAGYDWSQKVEFAIFSEKRHFYVDGYQFLGTIVLEFGNSIYHVFYRNI